MNKIEPELERLGVKNGRECTLVYSEATKEKSCHNKKKYSEKNQ